MNALEKQIKDSEYSKVVALIGENPSKYSLSRIIWNSAFFYNDIDAEYIPFDLPANDLEETVDFLLNSEKVQGFNVTNPYKHKLTEDPRIITDKLIKMMGGVNTIEKMNKEYYGHSTDGYGLISAIMETNKDYSFTNKNVLILGAGDTGSAISLELAYKKANISLANRTIQKAKDIAEILIQYKKIIKPLELYSDAFLESMLQAELIINTIPSEKNTKTPLFDKNQLGGKQKLCVDIVYGHDSPFLEIAKKNGHQTMDGSRMLLHQAAKSFTHIYNQEMNKQGLTIENIILPMRYALENFKFDLPNNLIRKEIEALRLRVIQEITS